LNYGFSSGDKPKNSGDYYGLRYAEFVVPLVRAVQELNNKVIEENKQLKEELAELRQMVRHISAI
jgi:trimeric autotransporter adhesin